MTVGSALLGCVFLFSQVDRSQEFETGSPLNMNGVRMLDNRVQHVRKNDGDGYWHQVLARYGSHGHQELAE